MNIIQWLKVPENIAAFEQHVLPLICEANGRVIGGRYKIMYQPWAHAIALSLHKAGCDRNIVSWEPIPEGEPRAGEFFPVFNYGRMKLVFGLYSRLLMTKWSSLLTPETRAKVKEEQKRRDDWYSRPRGSDEIVVPVVTPSAPTPEDRWATVAVIEKTEETLEVPTPDRYAKRGWLGRDGSLYPCEAQGHNRLQVALQRALGVPNLERAGWVKLSFDHLVRNAPEWYQGDMSLSPDQEDAIFEWCVFYDEPHPKF